MPETHDAGNTIVRQVTTEWIQEISPDISSSINGKHLIILPLGIEAGVAIFKSDAAEIPKLLRSNGVDAAFLTTANGRTFASTHSAGSEIVLGILLNVLSNGIYDAAKATYDLLRVRWGGRNVTIRQGLMQDADGSNIVWHEISGPSDVVLPHALAVTEALLAQISSAPKATNGIDRTEK